jgi:hypothetical protein
MHCLLLSSLLAARLAPGPTKTIHGCEFSHKPTPCSRLVVYAESRRKPVSCVWSPSPHLAQPTAATPRL